MKYKNIVQGTFIKRPNRFIAHCQVGEEVIIAHVKNTGRCKELLIEGATIFLEYAPSPKRKTDYSLIAIQKGNYLINMDSQVPNHVVIAGLKNKAIQLPGLTGAILNIKKEVTFGTSRFDVYVETNVGEKAYIEVKGVTLEQAGIAKFPDAPTTRGTKHINELIQVKKDGHKAYILFLIQMKPIQYFTPNKEMDPNFSEALQNAKKSGVEILAYDCEVAKDSIAVSEQVEVRL